jgi:hypothetical protein
MAGGGKIRIADADNLSELARVVNGRLLVSSAGGGGGGGDVNITQVGGVAIGATVPVSGSVSVNNFPATQSVTQGTSPWVVGGTVAVTQPITVVQPTHTNLKADVRLQGADLANFCSILHDAGPLTADVDGPPPMFECVDTDAGFPVTLPDAYSKAFINSSGEILVSARGLVSISAVTPGTGATQLGKAEDAAHVSADVGVMALAVRRDTLASSTSANGDYATLSVTDNGALWVREAGVQTLVLSGSTRGRPIAIAATASAGTLLHTATTTAGQLDKIFIWLSNISAAAVIVTIEFGAAGAGLELDVIVPANETVLAVNGAVLGGAATDTIRAYAGTANVVNAIGRVERL